MISNKSIKSAMESMMFVSGEPVEAKEVAEIFNITKEDAIRYFEELMEEYDQEGRGIGLRRINDSFQFITREENSEYISRLFTPVKIKRLSQSALEVLAIIAYKQPVTKAEIDAIRGIKSDRVIEGLMKKELVEEKGRADTVGRPILYATTKEFLKNFGFSNIKELPDIQDIAGDIALTSDEMNEDKNQLTFEFAKDGEGSKLE